MKITTSKGKTFDIRYIGSPLRDGDCLMIELNDNRLYSASAFDFEGLNTITMTDDDLPNEKRIYEGFTQLDGMQRNKKNGSVRLTLCKP